MHLKTILKGKVFYIFLSLNIESIFMSEYIQNEVGESGLTENRAQLKDNIVELAMSMFKSRGIKDVTMDEIASCMGISKRTLYEIFENKEDLLVCGVLKKRNFGRDFVDKFLDGELNIMELTLKWYEYVLKMHHEICPQFYLDIKKYKRVMDMIHEFDMEDRKSSVEYYRRGVADGFFRDDINYDIIDWFIRDQVDKIFSEEVFVHCDFEEVYKTIMLTCLRGITTPKGLAILEDFLKTVNKNK